MKNYQKFLVLSTDTFNPLNFPFIAEEIRCICEKTAKLSSAFKTDMIISFLKNHSLQNNWKDQNPVLTKMITTGSLLAGNIEALFELSRNNLTFRLDLENYVFGLILAGEDEKITR